MPDAQHDEARDDKMFKMLEGLVASNKRLAADVALVCEKAAAPPLKGEPAQKQQKRAMRSLTGMQAARAALEDYGQPGDDIDTAKKELEKGARAFAPHPQPIRVNRPLRIYNGR